jgi:hypothetical protein
VWGKSRWFRPQAEIEFFSTPTTLPLGSLHWRVVSLSPVCAIVAKFWSQRLEFYKSRFAEQSSGPKSPRPATLDVKFSGEIDDQVPDFNGKVHLPLQDGTHGANVPNQFPDLPRVIFFFALITFTTTRVVSVATAAPSLPQRLLHRVGFGKTTMFIPRRGCYTGAQHYARSKNLDGLHTVNSVTCSVLTSQVCPPVFPMPLSLSPFRTATRHWNPPGKFTLLRVNPQKDEIMIITLLSQCPKKSPSPSPSA